MVIEESSVVAAASNAKYWSNRGGFHAKVLSTIKEGSVYFIWKGDFQLLTQGLSELDGLIRRACQGIDVTHGEKRRWHRQD